MHSGLDERGSILVQVDSDSEFQIHYVIRIIYYKYETTLLNISIVTVTIQHNQIHLRTVVQNNYSTPPHHCVYRARIQEAKPAPVATE